MTSEQMAERLNDAWAVIRCVPHDRGNWALARHDRPVDPDIGSGLMDGLADDMLEIARYLRPAS